MVQAGVRVPDDLAIVGYDDVEFAQAAAVPLTSVSQPRHLLGRTATELLLAEARNDPDPRAPRGRLRPRAGGPRLDPAAPAAARLTSRWHPRSGVGQRAHQGALEGGRLG